MTVSLNSHLSCVQLSQPSDAVGMVAQISLDDSRSFNAADAVWPPGHPQAGQEAGIPESAVGARYTLISNSSTNINYVRFSTRAAAGIAAGSLLSAASGEVLTGFAGQEAELARQDLIDDVMRTINFHVGEAGQTAVIQIQYAPNACASLQSWEEISQDD